MSRWRCKGCGETLNSDNDFLTAPNPFCVTDGILGCPKCKDVECFEMLCDTPGCKNIGCAGTPTPDGYKWTCHNHLPEDAK